MAPSSNTSPVPLPRRQSCDRCHSMKLRCTRTGNSETGACNRCLRSGAQCVYSSSLPKGRPSMYRPAGERRPPASPRAATIDFTTSSAGSDIPPTSMTDGTTRTDGSIQLENSTTNNDIDQLLAGSIDPSSIPCTWPWIAPMDWDQMQIDGGDNDFLNLTHQPPTLPSACFPDSQIPMIELFENATSIAKRDPDVGIAQLSQLSTRLYPLHRSSCSLAETAESSGQRSPEVGQPKSQALIDDTAFKAVAKWLVHGVSTNMDTLFRADHRLHSPNINPALQEPSTTGNTLHEAFAASHHLLEILRLLQSNATGGSSNDGVTAIATASMDFWITPQSTGSNDSIFGFDEASKSAPTSAHSSSYGRPSSTEYPSTVVTVVRHLVIACHTLLLNIYIAVLIALQHDVDLRNSYLPTAGGTACAEATALADMRLVLVVQLCSYLIKRQHQAVDMYLCSPNSLPQSAEPSNPSSNPPDPQASGRNNGEVRGDLEMEVQQRLSRLRQTLRI
ncbi:hypothetical protein QBC36DRAFT_198313 [Triangularia setosa]|uniref:Zn(2)-C6 fungal-type domain-containing protein n=1 Tax=Triangularia setosa TaxID=2587417 RepID=A0AAN6VY10_9PEZI|nr:hypothetical protein QBC36DRAFT_198313 [Podospora setosa]